MRRSVSSSTRRRKVMSPVGRSWQARRMSSVKAQPTGQFALKRFFGRTRFRPGQDPNSAGRAFRIAAASMGDREMFPARGLQHGLACGAVDRDVVGQRSKCRHVLFLSRFTGPVSKPAEDRYLRLDYCPSPLWEQSPHMLTPSSSARLPIAMAAVAVRRAFPAGDQQQGRQGDPANHPRLANGVHHRKRLRPPRR
jgi:hypothetical protein